MRRPKNALPDFESYFNLRRQKSLRRYSCPVNLSRFDRLDWMTAEKDLWEIPEYLANVPHRRLLPGRSTAFRPWTAGCSKRGWSGGKAASFS